eukprot:7247646-Karenia_brevis.AAC.1
MKLFGSRGYNASLPDSDVDVGFQNPIRRKLMSRCFCSHSMMPLKLMHHVLVWCQRFSASTQ